jgi:hypothetical protein
MHAGCLLHAPCTAGCTGSHTQRLVSQPPPTPPVLAPCADSHLAIEPSQHTQGPAHSNRSRPQLPHLQVLAPPSACHSARPRAAHQPLRHPLRCCCQRPICPKHVSTSCSSAHALQCNTAVGDHTACMLCHQILPVLAGGHQNAALAQLRYTCSCGRPPSTQSTGYRPLCAAAACCGAPAQLQPFNATSKTGSTP